MNTQENLQNIQTRGPNWRNVGLFLALTFGLTWLLNLLLWRIGFGTHYATGQFLQVQMLLPAFSAILLGLFFFKDSRAYRTQGRARWFFYFYLIFTVLYAAMAALSLALPDQAVTLNALSGVVNIVGLVILVLIRMLSGSEAFAKAGLSGGKPMQWLLWGVAFLIFFALQTALNAVFNLGEIVDPTVLLAGVSGGQTAGMTPTSLRILLFFQTALLGPFLGLLLGFGEEYGWRGYLQGELIKIGKKRGVLLLGVIWGAWHYPVIWMGYNYPGQPFWGTLMMTGFTVLLGFVLGHVMLKTGSVWLAAFLHALNNQALAYFSISFYQASDPIFSFGIGVFGLLTALPVVLWLLRDPVWRDEPVQEAVRPIAA